MNLKMKDLEARTGLTRQAIHFYLREGLLPEPERPKRNVANYSEEHVARIKLIKRLQEERFLPLSVIKDLLQDADLDEASDGGLARLQVSTLSLMNGDAPAPDQTFTEVVEQTGIAARELESLYEAGVIEIELVDGVRMLDCRDAVIVARWQRLLDLGFRGVPGYDASYLARYAEAVQRLAEVEVAGFLREFRDEPAGEAADLAVQGIDVSNDILSRLRTQALLRCLDDRVSTETVN